MRSFPLLPVLFSATLLAACCQTETASGGAESAKQAASLPAVMTLQAEQSALNFISIKNGAIAETHQFKTISGSWTTATGELSVSVDLGSVETNIGIRNDRMKEFLFEVEQYPLATLAAKVDVEQLQDLAPGEQQALNVEAKLDLHGQQQALQLPLLVTRGGKGQLSVTTMSPIMVNANSFGLVDGINKLRELAKLGSIATAVPVTFNVTFE